MEILLPKNYKELLDFLPHLKMAPKEWLIVTVALTAQSDKEFTVNELALLVLDLFKDKPGKLYVGNERDILLILRRDANVDARHVAQNIETHLPANSCEINVVVASSEGIEKLELSITYRKPAPVALLDQRKKRKDNIILVADDDMYQRTIIKSGLAKLGTVVECMSGDEVLDAYRRHNPDILFLDIHMPGRSGRDIVYELSELDPDSYIIMISADGSHENIADTWQKGARDFLTKPFNKARLIECAGKCPTIAEKLV